MLVIADTSPLHYLVLIAQTGCGPTTAGGCAKWLQGLKMK